MIQSMLKRIITNRDCRRRYLSFFFDNQISSSAKGDNIFELSLSDQFSVKEYPNGGYLSAICIRACQRVTHINTPISLSAHFFNKTEEGKVASVKVEILRSSKYSVTASAVLKQDNIPRCAFMITFSNPATYKGPPFTKSMIESPVLPPPAECVHGSALLRDVNGPMLKVANHFDFFFPPNDSTVQRITSFSDGKGDSMSYECWMKMSDNRSVCSTSLAFLSDCVPPPILGVVDAHWLPTVEYNVQFWGVPSSGQDAEYVSGTKHPLLVGQGESPWVRARFGTTHVTQGMLCTDGEIWSEDGKFLLANSRQLAKIIL